ncbi:hypothetical protein [Saccharopolyspora montiporae]|uniref:hypothetical protein n=1 Tax=Saccharopolyspora montiporae TaxID=2781240 RepID=UPI00351C0242
MDQGRIELNLLDRSTVRTRARNVAIAAVVLGAAVGGVFGLFAGVTGFAIAGLVIALPFLLLAVTEARKTTFLQDGTVSVRALGTRSVALGSAERLDVIVTDLRGARTVNLLVRGRSRRALTVSLAMYAGTGGRELGIYELRRLADALASTGSAQALVLSELIVAQLRAEARGDGAPDRPLYRLASLAPEGRVAQQLKPEAVARFVAELDG